MISCALHFDIVFSIFEKKDYLMSQLALNNQMEGKLNASPKHSASQMLCIMQALSAGAQEAGVADMSLDEINAEIDAARKI